MSEQSSRSSGGVPARAWVVTLAGTAVNLCLGILYAWSVWKANLVAGPEHPAGSPMTGLNEGWTYLTDAQATLAYAICGALFALSMIVGGRLQDRCGPRLGTTLSGLFLGAGCCVAGYLQSYAGLVAGFGVLGGVGMGLGYAAATPAAVKWFGPHQRGLIVGLVVGGFGGAAIYISPLAKWLIETHGLSGSFYGLGGLFAAVILGAGQLLAWPPAGYVPPAPPVAATPKAGITTVDWTAGEMAKTWQFYVLIFLFLGSAQSGLLVIANATPVLNRTAITVAFFAANAWILSSYGGLVNAVGRVGTGLYSDKIGRVAAFRVNSVLAVACLFAMPSIIASGSVVALFLAIGVVYWQYGGGLSLLPAFTADYFGAKNLGFNYGLVFLGWGLAFFVPLLAGHIKDLTGSLDAAFHLSGGLLAAAVFVSLFLRRPLKADEPRS